MFDYSSPRIYLWRLSEENGEVDCSFGETEHGVRGHFDITCIAHPRLFPPILLLLPKRLCGCSFMLVVSGPRCGG